MAACILSRFIAIKNLRNSVCKKPLCEAQGLIIAQKRRQFSTKTEDSAEGSTDDDNEQFNDYSTASEEDRNCSRMSDSTWRKNSGLPPIIENVDERFRNNKRFRRSLYGRYGESSELNPAHYCWPTEKELQETMKLEQMEWSLQEKISILEEFKKRDQEKLQKHQENIAVAMHKMPTIIAKLEAKKIVESKKEEEKQVKVRNELEEARAIYGSSLQLNDPVFIQYLIEKKEEQARLKKEQRKKERAEVRKQQRSLY